jgi:UDP-glucose 4-epimerase
MRVMLTGATTPLGAAIIDRLLVDADVDHVLAIGREREAPPSPGRITYRNVDLTHTRAVHDLVWGHARELDVSVVIHAAQHRSVHDVGRRVHDQNVGATRALLAACSDHPTITRFVYRSFAEVYAPPHGTSELIDEQAPLDFDPAAPQWIRDRVEADSIVCAAACGGLEIAVLRCAEILAPDVGSQLWDYLESHLCLRPLGYDPMINVLAVEDAAAAFTAAVGSPAVGVFNIAGYDTLPLSRAIEDAGRAQLAVPGPLMAPLYKLRRQLAGFEFRYELNERRFHFGGVLDGTRARRELGYVPRTAVPWPCSWWRTLFERLGRLRLERMA